MEDPYVTRPLPVGEPSSAGTRFRILRPYARGGLGEVFVALDEELHREVALKEIQQQHADQPESRARFLLEAEVTGGLEHPGIVPVYGLGTYADGRPFYAMRFIRGDSLEGGHRAASTPPMRSAADPGERGVQCASCCGGSSTSATRWTTPTAAACCTATSSRATSCSASTARRWSSIGAWPRSSAATRPPAGRRGAAAATRLGQRFSADDAAGSGRSARPQYMSPEQAAGRLDKLGPASDVYSLGATLYYAADRQGAVRSGGTRERCCRRVAQGDFRRPARSIAACRRRWRRSA